MIRIILVRHGHTPWNEGSGERFRGRSALDLNELGIRQAEATAPCIAKVKVAALYTSPLPRAMTTARILARSLNIEPTPLEGLIDIDYGDWQGLSAEEAEARYPKPYSLWLQSPHLVAFPKGESLEQVLSRAMAAIEALSTIHPDQTIVLVSHKVVCKVLMCAFLGLELSQFWQVEQQTCCINGVEIKAPSPVVGLLNDTCHLRGVR